jgi:outer membrane biogenesis lipoprotein LolB
MKAVLLFISLLFAACAHLEPAGLAQQLVGHWRYADQVQSCQYSFKSDGSFTGSVKQREKLVSKFAGRWSIQDRTLHYLYLSDALGSIPAGATDQDQLLEVENDHFVIRAANGEQRRYLRVP